MQSIQFTAKLIKEMCDEKGISVNKMLIESGAGARTYHNMLAGSFPSGDKLSRIADYLECSVDYLLGRANSPEIVRIMDLLDKQNKKQVDLTNYLGITKNVFTDWKSGKNKSYKKYIDKIAEFFDVSADYLLGRTNEASTELIAYNGEDETKVKIKELLKEENDENHLKVILSMLESWKEE